MEENDEKLRREMNRTFDVNIKKGYNVMIRKYKRKEMIKRLFLIGKK